MNAIGRLAGPQDDRARRQFHRDAAMALGVRQQRTARPFGGLPRVRFARCHIHPGRVPEIRSAGTALAVRPELSILRTCRYRHSIADPGRRISRGRGTTRSEEHTSELQSLMRISYAVFCLKKKTQAVQKLKHREYTVHTKRTR